MTQVDENSFIYAGISNIASYLGVVSDPENIDQTINDTKQRIDDLKAERAELVKQNEQFEKTITDLKREVKEISDSNATIAELYKKKNDEDSTAIDDGLETSHKLHELKNYVYAIADHLKVKKGVDDDKKIVERILDEVIKISRFKTQTERDARFNKPVTPTVSQAIAAVGVKRKTFKQWGVGFLQALWVLN